MELTTPIRSSNKAPAYVDTTAVVNLERANPNPSSCIRNRSNDVVGSDLPMMLPGKLLRNGFTQKPTDCENSTSLLSPRSVILCKFFKAIVSLTRFIRMRKQTPTFSKLARSIESLTDRRFTLHHLAQLKYIMPEVIVLKKVCVIDDETKCMKEEIQVYLELNALESDKNTKCGGGFSQLDEIFQSRVIGYYKDHEESDDIPEGEIPQLFYKPKQEPEPSISNSPVPLATSLITIKETVCSGAAAASISELVSTPVKRISIPKELDSTPAKPTSILKELTSTPAKLTSTPKELASTPATPSSIPNELASTPATPSSFPKELALAPAKPTSIPKELASIPAKPTSIPKELASTPTKPTSIPTELASTPAEFASTPARLMADTPALRTPKRALASDHDSFNLSTKSTKRRSLNFDESSVDIEDPLSRVDEEDSYVSAQGSIISNDDVLEILPEDLLQSLKGKEKKILEENDPIMLQAKTRLKLMAGVPKLIDMISLLFQSFGRSVITKEELIYKLVTGHLDIIDRNEVEQQLKLLQEVAPEYISEHLSLSGDTLVRFNKLSCVDSMRAKLLKET